MTPPEPKSCPNCKTAKDFPAYRLFSPACMYCGARLIQSLSRLTISASECKARRQAVLADWVAHGHSEQAIRSLVAGPLCIGPEKNAACASQTSGKTH